MSEHVTAEGSEGRITWSRAKKDAAPRGVRRHPSGLWGIRFTCGAGHLHREKVGPLKSDAIRRYHECRARAHDEAGWCPLVERRQARELAGAERARERRRVTFRVYAAEYLEWSRRHKRSWETDAARLKGLVAAFGDRRLDEITAADVERLRDGLLESRARATANRYRDLLSGIFRRAIRDGHATDNPVRAVSKFKENNERVTFLTDAEEAAVWATLVPKHRPLFVVSVHTGLRWSEEVGLRWQDADFLTGFITVPRSKHGQARRVPMNSVVRGVLMDLAGARRRPDDPDELVFPDRPTEPAHFFPKAVERAAAAMKAAGEAAPHLGSYSWHGNRHTFASRLVMAGVDPITVQELGGWRSGAMVRRYAHLSPGHLHAAVERLVPAVVEVSRFCPGAEREAVALDTRSVTLDDQRARP